MDPNTALAQIRSLLEQADAQDNPFAADNQRHEATGIFRGLDEWLNRGGFLPDDWSNTL